jgi:predicted nucleic acid-binding Zn ribbon protein
MRKTNEQNIKEVLKDLVQTYRLQTKLTQAKVETLWAKLLGKTVQEHTTELRIRNHKLYVTVDSAPLRQELSYGRGEILEKLNRELGEDPLKEVLIK